MKYLFCLLISINAYAGEASFDLSKYCNDERNALRAVWDLFPETDEKTRYIKLDLMIDLRNELCLGPALDAIRIKNYAQLNSILIEHEGNIYLKNEVIKYAAATKKGGMLKYLFWLRLNHLDWDEALRSFLDNGGPIIMEQMLLALEVLMEAGASIVKVTQDKKRYGRYEDDAPIAQIIRESCFYSHSQTYYKEFTPAVQKRVLKLLIDGGPFKLP